MTHVMVKGSNIPVETSGVRAVLRWSPGQAGFDVDASVLLLGADDRVRSDADFVFYNAPRHPSGLARHLPKKRVPEGLTDTVEVDLTSLEPAVHRVVIAASCDSGTFQQARDLVLGLYDAGGAQHAAPVATFEVVPDTGRETALICGELYRKGDGWKFRALGQGYTTGLVGLATEFGIAVDDGEADSAGSAPSAPSAPFSAPSGAASGPSTPAAAPGPAEPAGAYGYPQPGSYPSHVPAQPAYGYPQPVAAQAPPAPPQQPPAPRQPAAPPQQPTVPPVHQQPQQGYPAYGYPQPVAAATAAAGQQPAGPDGAFRLPPQGPQFQSRSQS